MLPICFLLLLEIPDKTDNDEPILKYFGGAFWKALSKYSLMNDNGLVLDESNFTGTHLQAGHDSRVPGTLVDKYGLVTFFKTLRHKSIRHIRVPLVVADFKIPEDSQPKCTPVHRSATA